MTGLPQRPLLVYVQGVLPSLNPAERLIAEYVLADPERVISSSIGDMRRGAGASVGSIVSFCRSLGLKGFADFKIALARELAQAGLPPNTGEAQSLFEEVFRFHAQSLLDTAKINSDATLRLAARALERAGRIELFAIGISWPVAYLAACKLRLIGLPAAASPDSHMQVIAATQLRKRDVGFAISCSGSTRDTVQCLEVAKAKGACTLCITNSMKSPLTAFADHSLFATPSEVKYFQAPLASRVTQLAIVDALFVHIAQRHRDRTAAQLQSSAGELISRRRF